MSETTSSNIFIESSLHESLNELEKQTESDVLTYIGPIREPLDQFVRDVIEQKSDKKEKLTVILETNGGFIEVAERISNTLRNHYPHVEFIVPDHALSAGTVLAMSGNKIWMDYFSVLGPIDPQISIGGRMVPALGYVEKFHQLINKANSSNLNTAEMAFLIEKFDPAEIYHFEEAKRLSVDLLKDWLVRYKFADWTVTKSKGKPVTTKFKKQRAQSIAKKLGNPSHWHSHSRGINAEVLEKDVGLEIDDFRAYPYLFDRLNKYYRLLMDYMMRRGHGLVIHMGEEYVAA